MGKVEKILKEIKAASRKMVTIKLPLRYYRAIGTRKAEEIIRKHLKNDGWIPVEERLPEDNHFILLSFVNFDLPMIGRYETDKEGGAFYLGDCNEEDTCISQDLFVNAWRPLPEPYREGEQEHECDR